MILEILIAFLAGFLFFPIFLWFLWPILVEKLSEWVDTEKERIKKKKGK